MRNLMDELQIVNKGQSNRRAGPYRETIEMGRLKIAIWAMRGAVRIQGASEAIDEIRNLLRPHQHDNLPDTSDRKRRRMRFYGEETWSTHGRGKQARQESLMRTGAFEIFDEADGWVFWKYFQEKLLMAVWNMMICSESGHIANARC